VDYFFRDRPRDEDTAVGFLICGGPLATLDLPSTAGGPLATAPKAAAIANSSNKGSATTAKDTKGACVF
jgi:hypothetical protein